jgi:hypothetical protein
MLLESQWRWNVLGIQTTRVHQFSLEVEISERLKLEQKPN